MKIRLLLSAAMASCLIGLPAAQASDNETIFLNSQGKLVIPHLRLGNEIYFVILDRTNLGAYNFNLDGNSVTKITPQPGDDWASRSEVVGDWAFPELPGVALGIFASGSYSITTPAEDGCPAGTETGTWTHDESTGVFMPVAVTDANSDCGLSHPEGVIRIKRVGANLVVTFVQEENGGQQTVQITGVPR